jgi:nucleoside-diphosphate kinase
MPEKEKEGEAASDGTRVIPLRARRRVARFSPTLAPTGNQHETAEEFTMQTTLIILKPDAVQRGVMGRILARFEDKGLQVVGCKMMQISQSLAATHYEAHKAKGFYPGLVRFMTSSPVLVLALRGNDAIAIARNMMGATFGSKAAPGTIRGDFGVSNSFNLIHGSDSPEAAERELKLFFQPGEVLDWSRNADAWVYDMSGGKAE